MSDRDRGQRRARRNPYRELIHLLNRRYHREWERAEALELKLVRLRRWKILPLVEWLGRLGRRIGSLVRRPRGGLVESAKPFQCTPHAPRADFGRVSIIIPFKDRLELLRNCLRSLCASTYRRFEVILVDNGSVEPATHAFVARRATRRGYRIVPAPGPFNFSRLCNLGAERAAGEYLVFLNNDTEVLARDWLERLLDLGADPRVGVAGATLLYPDRTIQHAGIFPRADGIWAHAHQGRPADYPGENGELLGPRSVPAVTAACLLIRRSLFDELGGFDENLPVMFNDVDLCARVRRRGLHVVVSPDAKLFHYESLSRGYALDEPKPAGLIA